MSVQAASRQRGYSLTELLVVIAIVGAISLVTVPNFMAMMKASKFKTSLQQFANDCRSTRQRAITQYKRTKVAFNTAERAYSIYESTGVSGGVESWARVGNVHYMEENAYFATPTSFLDRDDDEDALIDVIFTNTGSLDVTGLASPYTVVLRTNDRIPKDQYTLDFKLAGSFTTVGSSWH